MIKKDIGPRALARVEVCSPGRRDSCMRWQASSVRDPRTPTTGIHAASQPILYEAAVHYVAIMIEGPARRRWRVTVLVRPRCDWRSDVRAGPNYYEYESTGPSRASAAWTPTARSMVGICVQLAPVLDGSALTGSIGGCYVGEGARSCARSGR